MLPLGLVNFLALAVLYELRQINDPAGKEFAWTVALFVGGWIVFAVAWLGTSLANPLVTDNRPRRDRSHAFVESQI
jgi:hypothetical protein